MVWRGSLSTGGYSGNHTYHSIANLVYTFLKLKPRVVVLMHNINDLALLSKTGSYHVAPPSRALTADRRMDGRLETLSGFARYLYPNLTRSVSRVLRKIRSGTTAPDEFEGLRGGVEVPEGRILEEFERALSTFHGICRSNGIELVLMTQFNRMDSLNLPYLRRIGASNGLSDLPRWIPVYTRMNQAIRDYSAREGLLCIDLDRLIPHDRRYIYDPVHLNNAGSRLAAEAISRELAGRLSFASEGGLRGGRRRQPTVRGAWSRSKNTRNPLNPVNPGSAPLL